MGGYFIERNLNIVSGHPGSYKTIFMLEVCSAIALGRPAFGLFPVEQGRITFITGDDPPEIFIERLLMLNSTLRSDGSRQLDPSVRRTLVDNVRVHVLDQTITVLNKDVYRWMASTIQGSDFVVLDPLQHFIGLANDNQANEIYEQLSPIRQMAASMPCAITMIHHSTKDGGATNGKMNAFRGSSAIRGLSRAQLYIERLNPGLNPPRISVVGENRYGAEPEPLTLEIEQVSNCITFSRPALADAIYNLVVENRSPIATNDIAKKFTEPLSAIRGALYRLRDKGLLQSHKVKKQSVWSPTGRVDTSVATASRRDRVTSIDTSQDMDDFNPDTDDGGL